MVESDIVLDRHWTNVIQSLRLRTAPDADPDIRMRPRWAILHLGGGDGSNSDGDIKWYDKEGNNVIHMSATETEDFDSDISAIGEDGYLALGGNETGGDLQIQGHNGKRAMRLESPHSSVGGILTVYDEEGNEGTTIWQYQIDTRVVDTNSIDVEQTLTANHGVIKDLDLGGGNPDEDIYEPGRLNVWSDEGKESVVVDGQSGSIEHTGTITQVSDVRAKRGVEPVEDALDTVRELEGVEYEWDDSVDLTLDDDRHVGFLAQDVEEVLPEAVVEHGTGYKGTADAAFTPLLVEAVKELAGTVEELAETIEEQRAELDAQATCVENQRDRIARLESRLADLEAEVRDGEE